jgi:branched-chain amino acid transport system substrate-binding protein
MRLKKNVSPSRRTVLKGIGAGAAVSAIAMPWVARAAGTIKIGVVAPATGRDPGS